jgi:hypothetical protein
MEECLYLLFGGFDYIIGASIRRMVLFRPAPLLGVLPLSGVNFTVVGC